MFEMGVWGGYLGSEGLEWVFGGFWVIMVS